MILKKSILCLSILSSCALIQLRASANEPAHAAVTNTSSSDADDLICDTYAQIDFGHGDKLSAEVFGKAMRGYLNLKAAGKLSDNKQLLTVADFTKSSAQSRLWIIDLKHKKVVYNTYVAHGQGSGDDYATTFSNQDGTHASSIGFYVTGDTYTGEHGNSLRLHGMDNGFNDAAYDRGIVMHAANYVSSNNIAAQGRLGRSWGCPAVAPELAQPIINLIKGGTCLFIYYPQPKYLKTAYWVNKKIEASPARPKLHLMAPGLENEQLALAKKPDTAGGNAQPANRL